GAGAENCDDDGQSHCRFGCGHRHDEEHKDLAFDRMPLMCEGDKAEVDGVEHQLNGHEHRDDIALDEKAHHAERKKNGAEKQIPGNWDGMAEERMIHFPGCLSPLFLRARGTAPRTAIRMSTEVTSKGRSNSWKST